MQASLIGEKSFKIQIRTEKGIYLENPRGCEIQRTIHLSFVIKGLGLVAIHVDITQVNIF